MTLRQLIAAAWAHDRGGLAAVLLAFFSLPAWALILEIFV